jgi:putative phage-type endonuclease
MSDLTPGSPEWLRIVTASKVAAILGLSPWDSPRSLWHKMHGDLPREEQNDAMTRGHYLEPAILAWWRDQHGVIEGEFVEQPTYTLDDWAAATPDMVACHPIDDNVLVEAKSTSMDWDNELPAYYLTQVLFQLAVSGLSRCRVPVIGPRLTFTEYVVDIADYAEDVPIIMARCRAFWESLAGDEPPPLDDSVATYDAVRKVHPEIERGAEVEVDAKQARALVEWCDELKSTEKSARFAKSTVIDLMGRAQYATHNGVRIARRQPRGNDVTFVVVAKPEDLQEIQ